MKIIEIKAQEQSKHLMKIKIENGNQEQNFLLGQGVISLLGISDLMKI